MSQRERRLLAPAVLAAATVVAYAVTRGWDREYDRDPVTGDLSGPYETWQVILCVVALAAIALVGGQASGLLTTALTVTVVFTVVWSIGSATLQTTGANLWPIGAFLVAVGTLAGASLVAGIGGTFRRRRHQ